MNCTSVLQVLNSRPEGPSTIMPADMAMRICLAHSPPLRPFLCEPLRPCLSSGRYRDVPMATTNQMESRNFITETEAEVEVNCSLLWMKTKKKSVVFADSKGLALATIHVFNEFEDDQLNTLHFHLEDKDPADCGSSLVLDFIPPGADYLDLRNRLKAQQVCLETCSMQEHLLSGTIQVRNLCFEKSVSVRITFDSWSSFKDIECQYLNNVYGCPDLDTFSFTMSVPELNERCDGVEFCIQYQTRDQTFWDNNQGNNYRLLVADPNGSLSRSSESSIGLEIQIDHSGEKREEMEFDPFGSPRTSAGIFPEWQSWGHIETRTPYW